MITLQKFIDDGYQVGSRCADACDNYFGTAVKIINNTVPYDYTQRRIIMDRLRRTRATPQDKKNYGMWWVMFSVVVFALLLMEKPAAI